MQKIMKNTNRTLLIVVGLLFAVALMCLGGAGVWFFWTARNATAPTPPVTAATPLPPQPTPTTAPVEFTGWAGEYFDNPNLQGEPVLVRDDEAINFDWGTNAPAAEVPAQNFSVRWTISREVPAGIYRFTGTFDNGVRVFVDDVLVADRWVVSPVGTDSVDVNLAAGTHIVRVEYFHGSGPAVAQFRADYLENFPDWKAEYFEQPDFNTPPVVVRNDLEINFNWGATSPIPGSVPDNNYVVRWSRGANLDDGNYLFRADVEGGIRIYLDGQLILDSWGESQFRTVEVAQPIARGRHGLMVEYWKESGNGQIRFGWSRLQDPNQPPLAVINGTSSAIAGQTVNFNARSSQVAEGSHLTNYDWDFGDGTTASGLDVSHAYANAGVYGVTLTVVDDKGLSGSTVQQIQIFEAQQPDQPPIPVIDAPSQARINETFTVDSSRSVSTNPIVRSSWDFGDGNRIDNAVRAQHSYQVPGTYRIRLTVEDNQGLKADAFHQITIVDVVQPTPEPDQPPVARINAPASVGVGESFTVNASSSQCATNCVSYAWDLGDGTQANAVSLQHSYGNPGEFNMVLVVTDDKGLQGTANHIIQVIADEPQQPPTAIINGPNTGSTGEELTFDGNGSQQGTGGVIIEYFWEFGDGNTAQGPVASNTFTEPGGRTVRLTVTDEAGERDTADWPVMIYPAAPAPEVEPQPEGESTPDAETQEGDTQ
jgi:PKD repeat protein